jgi:hypothetical protein
MAIPGQLKAKIDLLKKKIAEKGATLTPERRRQQKKRLRRLQRARRTALAVEKSQKAQAKAGPGTVAPAAPVAQP